MALIVLLGEAHTLPFLLVRFRDLARESQDEAPFELAGGRRELRRDKLSET